MASWLLTASGEQLTCTAVPAVVDSPSVRTPWGVKVLNRWAGVNLDVGVCLQLCPPVALPATGARNPKQRPNACPCLQRTLVMHFELLPYKSPYPSALQPVCRLVANPTPALRPFSGLRATLLRTSPLQLLPKQSAQMWEAFSLFWAMLEGVEWSCGGAFTGLPAADRTSFSL